MKNKNPYYSGTKITRMMLNIQDSTTNLNKRAWIQNRLNIRAEMGLLCI